MQSPYDWGFDFPYQEQIKPENRGKDPNVLMLTLSMCGLSFMGVQILNSFFHFSPIKAFWPFTVGVLFLIVAPLVAFKLEDEKHIKIRYLSLFSSSYVSVIVNNNSYVEKLSQPFQYLIIVIFALVLIGLLISISKRER